MEESRKVYGRWDVFKVLFLQYPRNNSVPTRQWGMLYALIFYKHTWCCHRHYIYVAYVHKAIKHLWIQHVCMFQCCGGKYRVVRLFCIALIVLMHASSRCNVFFRAGACSAQRHCCTAGGCAQCEWQSTGPALKRRQRHSSPHDS